MNRQRWRWCRSVDRRNQIQFAAYTLFSGIRRSCCLTFVAKRLLNRFIHSLPNDQKLECPNVLELFDRKFSSLSISFLQFEKSFFLGTAIVRCKRMVSKVLHHGSSMFEIILRVSLMNSIDVYQQPDDHQDYLPFGLSTLGNGNNFHLKSPDKLEFSVNFNQFKSFQS